MTTTTHTRTHVYVEFANPYFLCDGQRGERCGQRVRSWHNPERCGCGESGWYNVPCGHQAPIRSLCYSWSPVRGCTCEDSCEQWFKEMEDGS